MRFFDDWAGRVTGRKRCAVLSEGWVVGPQWTLWLVGCRHVWWARKIEVVRCSVGG